ncbi:MAG: kinase, partial [Aliifodinibius sp.]|nr:kinase [Fodinibius sp.]NIY29625.1 kinase [Fodinibius sp.]
MLFFTGLAPRTTQASQIAEEQIKQIPSKSRELAEMYRMVDEAINIFSGESDLVDFGKLLHQSWQLKRSLTDKISTPYIDYVYDMAIRAG